MKKLFVLLTLVVSVSIIALLYRFQPEPKRRVPAPSVTVVETMQLSKNDYPVYFETFGTVRPAKEVDIVSEVEGVVLAKNPELLPGGIISAGSIMAQIDSRHYQFIVEDRKASVRIAENDIEIEQGQQMIARQEWELLKDELQATDKGKNLVLRQPQLEIVRARLAAAQSKLDQALLDIEKSTIIAPFNALVIDSFVENAQFVSPNTSIARLISTDEFWVHLSLPVTLLEHLDIPLSGTKRGSPVAFYAASGKGAEPLRTGHILRLLPEVNADTRMAGLLVSVPDPLQLAGNKNESATNFLVGSYVRAQVDCGTLANVISIPQGALYNQNMVWLYENGTLRRQEVSIVWQRKDDVLVSTDISDAHLVISRLLNPLDGMKVRSSSLQAPEAVKKRRGEKRK